ncbi:hypothetical protein MHUMG1_06097 [Metarhizium humberi]|uniref:Peptidyl-prolyl cis-trans isomerase n=1 Tax=Metarhizium humberi TaxID=2596975 RepID=A0A9P8S638_9HYPO|nr:hypothetical protein MHUMG1_06097 [Metarhizium humberi]
MGKNDKKGAEKSAGKGKGADKESGGKGKGAQAINVRHILCEKHAKKEEALAKLNDGVKFDEVARNYSEDKARQGLPQPITSHHHHHKIDSTTQLTACSITTGGALGWKTKGSLDPKFEEAAFALEPSTTNNPKIAEAKTEFGYHIIMVEGRK